MSIRDETYEFRDALSEAIVKATDDTENSEEVGVLLTKAFRVISEGADFAKIPQDERLEAVMLALAGTLNKVAEAKIVFSDETEGGG